MMFKCDIMGKGQRRREGEEGKEREGDRQQSVARRCDALATTPKVANSSNSNNNIYTAATISHSTSASG